MTWMGTEMERERRGDDVEGGGGSERDFLRWEGRERKVSLEAIGSIWDWWERKESKPNIGADEIVVEIEKRKNTRRLGKKKKEVDAILCV